MSCFFKALKTMSEYTSLTQNINKNRLPIGVLGLAQIHKANIISSLCKENSPRQAVIITPDEAQASRLCRDLLSFGCNALLYPAGDISLRTTQIKSREYEHRRLSVLGHLLDGNAEAVVMSAEAALQYTIPPEELFSRRIHIKVGEDMSIKELTERLVRSGYTSCDSVEGSGQYSVRGGIVDLFSPDSDLPFRIDFWGDTIDSISVFETDTQRRVKQIDEMTITPANEICCEREKLISIIESFAATVKGKGSVKVKESLFKDIESLKSGVSLSSLDRYLPLIYKDCASVFDYVERPMLFVSESFTVKDKANAAIQLFNEEYKAYLSEGVVCKGLEKYILTWSEMLKFYEDLGVIYLDNLARGSFDTPVKELITFNARQISPWNGSMSVLKDDLEPITGKDGNTVIIMSGTAKAASALSEDLNGEGFPCIYMEDVPDDLPKGKIAVLPGGFSSGFEYPSAHFTVITYGSREALPVAKKRKKVNKAAVFNSLEELHKGDYIVHSAHGIGIFDGITQLESDGNVKDYIKIKYDKGDVLYVPVTQLDQVSKYIGPNSDSHTLKLNRLGGGEWNKTRTRVRSAVKDMAKELIELYAKRTNMKGYAFSPDIDMQNDFERRFEFEETDDQIRCINEIKNDMEKPCPMDRLLCGDVGFGKTEVALRAAFKCVADGKQCAILVPTTILAMQHFQTICRRFDGFPIEAQMISRFVPQKQQEKIKKDLKRGYVDIIVGTHRLISKDIEFRDLGLIIIDEEQRFGVAQKEKLKSLYPSVDVLTLTATPIPRTLVLTQFGDMDYSKIDELPAGRKPVTTTVMPLSKIHEVVDALKRKLQTQTQAYWVCPLVEESEKIDLSAAKERYESLRQEFGNIVGLVHGKMKESEKNAIMEQFKSGKLKLLVSTTVIEVGVNVPNATVMIIEHAQRFGLAQLHQLRGRIKRGFEASSCILMYGYPLSDVSRSRLNIMKQTEDGFLIAEEDLKLRGGGEVLGTRQSGFSSFKVADLSVHGDLLLTASKDAALILNQDKNLSTPRGAALRTLMYLFERDEAIKTYLAG